MARYEDPSTNGESPGTPVPSRHVGPYEASLAEARERAQIAERKRRSQKRRRLTILAAASAAVVAISAAAGMRLLNPTPTVPSGGIAPVAQTTNIAAAGCKKPTSLTVNVPEAMATTFTALVEAYQTQPDVPCASFTIVPQAASVVAQSIAGPDRPDAWVVDSRLWLTQANHRAGLGLASDAPFATSQIVVAMQSKMADEAAGRGWKELATGDAKLVLPDPNTSTVGLLSLVAAGRHWSPTQFGAAAATSASYVGKGPLLQVVSDPGHEIMAPVTAAELAAYNVANPSSPVAAINPADGAAALEYSLVSVADGTLATRVLKSLRDFVATDEAGDIVTRGGFTLPGAKPGVAKPSNAVRGAPKPVAAPTAAAVAAARKEWAIFAPPPQLVIALDVSSTSLMRMDGVTILDLMRQTTQSNVASLPEGSTVALWAFAQHLGDSGADHTVLAPSAALSAPAQVQAIAKGLASLESRAGGERGLYDTIVAAQAAAGDATAPGRANTAVIITSGGNEDDFGVSLGQAKAAVARGVNPAHNLRLVVIGVGSKADRANLSAVAKSAGGRYVAVTTAAQLNQALKSALSEKP